MSRVLLSHSPCYKYTVIYDTGYQWNSTETPTHNVSMPCEKLESIKPTLHNYYRNANTAEFKGIGIL